MILPCKFRRSSTQTPPIRHCCVSSTAETGASCSNHTITEFACKSRRTGGICMQERQNMWSNGGILHRRNVYLILWKLYFLLSGTNILFPLIANKNIYSAVFVDIFFGRSFQICPYVFSRLERPN